MSNDILICRRKQAATLLIFTFAGGSPAAGLPRRLPDVPQAACPLIAHKQRCCGTRTIRFAATCSNNPRPTALLFADYLRRRTGGESALNLHNYRTNSVTYALITNILTGNRMPITVVRYCLITYLLSGCAYTVTIVSDALITNLLANCRLAIAVTGNSLITYLLGCRTIARRIIADVLITNLLATSLSLNIYH
ncbi:MAG: hypothetical protein NTY60_10430 [Proteobacteria bacterium]|nr:hypothetical protein [Pseudomonadota bacterium]